MKAELDRIIKELDILRINIASMAARVESIQASLEQLKSQSMEPDCDSGVSEISVESLPQDEVCTPDQDACAIADAAEMEETDDALETPGDSEPEPAVEIAAEPELVDEPELSDEDTTVDELRHPARELRQFFTINDRYRFRRELFGNSDTSMADLLNMIEAMSSVTEAQDYVYSDLEWDPDNEEVQEFMTIVTRYFNER